MTHHVLQSIPLFPLPNLVLLPGAIAPLHIFEPRYRQMMVDVLDDDCRIAMALLKPGWEKHCHGPAAICPVVCVGRVLTHELLPDGRCNLLLQGQSRAAVVREHAGKAYRQAEVELLPQKSPPEAALTGVRRQMLELMSRGILAQAEAAKAFRKLLSGGTSTAIIADMLAFHFIDHIGIKQRLLEEIDVARRLAIVMSVLQSMSAVEVDGYRKSIEQPSMN